MRVKRTKKGFTILLDWHLRSELHKSLTNGLSINSRIQLPLTSELAIKSSLCNAVLTQLLVSKNFSLDWSKECKWNVTVAEAIALMWHLRHHDNSIEMLDLKSEIHKQLHA